MRFRRSCIVNKLLVGRGGRYLYKIFESLFRTASDYQFRSTKVWQPWAVGDSPDIRSHLVPVGAEGGREGKKENIPRKPGPGGGSYVSEVFRHAARMLGSPDMTSDNKWFVTADRSSFVAFLSFGIFFCFLIYIF